MDLFIDFEFLKDASGELVVKELCGIHSYYDNDTPSVKCAMFLPPSHWERLPAKIKSCNQWDTRNSSGIPWEAGNAPYDKLNRVLKKLIFKKKPYYIFVANKKKKQWLEKKIGTAIPVIEVKRIGYRRNNQIFLKCNYDAYHQAVRNAKCAFQHAYRMYQWFKDRWGASSSEKSNMLFVMVGENLNRMAPRDSLELSYHDLQLYV